jgi:hypothetical protein
MCNLDTSEQGGDRFVRLDNFVEYGGDPLRRLFMMRAKYGPCSCSTALTVRIDRAPCEQISRIELKTAEAQP